ncbi:chemotaxis protein CheA [Thiorhodospira sibirica]|uniref:chemotaxis protein CheA n=1 Tax=Thiorhodospira sibirica TaxID=154347 RepID=UPI00022C0545|nr:chemotaxis protein CheA [Thiorhodospira sibirica]
MSATMADALQTFFAEANNLLSEMEEALLALKEGPAEDTELIHALFRAAHTIKGSAGLFGLDAIVAFTHQVESVLDQVRDGNIGLDATLLATLMRAHDHIFALLEHEDRPLDEAMQATDQALVRELCRYLGTEIPATTATATDSPPAASPSPAQEGDIWHISLRFGEDVLQNGMDPLSFLHYLQTFGEIVHLVTLPDRLPPAAQMNPEHCYLGFEIRFASCADKAQIEGAFDFVRDSSAIRILPPGSRLHDYVEMIENLPEKASRLGELLVGCGAITRRELDEVLNLQARQDGEDRPLLGDVLVQEQLVQRELVDAALHRQQEVRNRQHQEHKLLRVQAHKLDSLIDLIGELVIAHAGLRLLVENSQDSDMLESVSEVTHLVEEIRDTAMHLRMVEIGETFSRFRRVVREVSKETGKEIELLINGGDTELDKTVVDRIGDPLTHLIRNAIDHGIEPTQTRLQRGKPAQGTVALNAYHESGGIVIEVSDDGSGLDRERILRKAQQRGLVQNTQVLSDEQICKLIFEAGFSTAEQVSNLSGRGVGMDVVKRSIEGLRGTIEIDSQAGQGSTFRIRLPLSLAIIDGFLMRVADGHYVVPLDMVLECVEFDPRKLTQGQAYLDLRGEILPLLRLREYYKLSGKRHGRQNVVVVQWGQRKAGFVVDELKGELQAVIKPLGPVFSALKGIAGSTILGSGEVALVLDVSTLLDQAAGLH